MRVSELAKKHNLELNEIKEILEALGVPETGRSHLSSVSEEIEAEVHKVVAQRGGKKIAESNEHVTTLPSGKKVIILFSPIKRLKIALPGGVNDCFENNQRMVDCDDKADMAVYDAICRIGPQDAFVVLPRPYPENSVERDEFDRKLEDWLKETEFGSTGQPSVRGSLRVQALFHREEQEEVSKKRGEVTARTLKIAAVNTKSLAPARY